MAARCSITFKVHTAWRLKPYLHVLAFFCAVMACEPDTKKLDAVIWRAVKLKLV